MSVEPNYENARISGFCCVKFKIGKLSIFTKLRESFSHEDILVSDFSCN